MTTTPRLIPLWVKIAYTAFMAILIPIYLKNYGPTNFLYFCDVAILMTLLGVWLESPLLLSAPLVGIFIPQMIWVADFLVEVASWSGKFSDKEFHLAGMTGYMFKPPFLLRFLSFFHFWLPFFLLWLVWRVGYDKRGLVLWMVLMWLLLTICYVWMPPPSPVHDTSGTQLRDPNLPVNINYVYNIASDEKAQEWMNQDVYFASYMAILAVIYLVTHFLCATIMPPSRREATG
jgi:hypothetical protein